MNGLQLAIMALFGFGYVAITFEHQLKTEKAPIAMLMGALSWVVLRLSGFIDPEVIKHAFTETMVEILEIFLFLHLAMTLVEVVTHYDFFEAIRHRLLQAGMQDRQQALVIAILTFFLSAILDNLTITIVMVTIATRFFVGRNLAITAALIVISANAGGAWSPIGDVTTIMLWLERKFTASQVVLEVFLPSLAHALTAMVIMLPQIGQSDSADNREDMEGIIFRKSERLIIGLALASFLLPLVFMQVVGLPPFLGLFTGLALVWLTIGWLRIRAPHQTHLNADVGRLLRGVDHDSLLFFVGILLSVGALQTVGILDSLSHLLLGSAPSFERVAGTNVVLGYLSAIVDNVPLTALAMNMVEYNDHRVWTLLAYTVGTGGSHLVIGSVAGVVAMGIVKELTSTLYFKLATKAVAYGYVVGLIVWGIQTWLVG